MSVCPLYEDHDDRLRLTDNYHTAFFKMAPQFGRFATPWFEHPGGAIAPPAHTRRLSSDSA